jgi:hypothetical protein
MEQNGTVWNKLASLNPSSNSDRRPSSGSLMVNVKRELIPVRLTLQFGGVRNRAGIGQAEVFSAPAKPGASTS